MPTSPRGKSFERKSVFATAVASAVAISCLESHRRALRLSVREIDGVCPYCSSWSISDYQLHCSSQLPYFVVAGSIERLLSNFTCNNGLVVWFSRFGSSVVFEDHTDRCMGHQWAGVPQLPSAAAILQIRTGISSFNTTSSFDHCGSLLVKATIFRPFGDSGHRWHSDLGDFDVFRQHRGPLCTQIWIAPKSPARSSPVMNTHCH